MTAHYQGMPSIGPALKATYHLSLVEVGILLTSGTLGVAVTLLPWGVAADHFGERRVLAIGLGACAVFMAASAFAPDFRTILACFFLAGTAGAVANSASGRAVMAWFGRSERGTALGIRQMATPLGGALAAASLPGLYLAFGLRACLLAVAVFIAVAAVACGLWLLPAPGSSRGERTAGGSSPLRDRRIWRLAVGGMFIVAGQLSFVTYVTTFLNQHRLLALGAAGAVLAIVQLVGAFGRVGIGRLSDRLGQRIGLLRWVAVLAGVALVATGLLVDAPLAALLPVLVIAGFFSMVSNGLAFTATGEIAGTARAATAMGFQNTFLFIAGVAAPIAFGALVSAAGWRWGFVAVGVVSLFGWVVLAPLEPAEIRGWDA